MTRTLVSRFVGYAVLVFFSLVFPGPERGVGKG